MKLPSVRILVVDDYEPWRRFVSSTLQQHVEFLIVDEASDGLSAVQKSQELRPDLILLDIGLPKLNGIEAARRIRAIAPNTKILVISENGSWDIAKEGLRSGGGGYLVKSDAGRELLPAIRAVLQGQQFVSASLAAHHRKERLAEQSAVTGLQEVVTPPIQEEEVLRRHEVGLYSDDRCLVENVAEFIGSALKAGNAAVVVATEAHRDGLLRKLQAHGLDMDAATAEGRYVAADAAKTVASYMVDGMPDRARFLKAFGDLVTTVAKAATAEHPRVAVFGEGVDLVWAQGNEEGAIAIEKLGNELTQSYDVDILCGYSLANVHGGMNSPTFQRACAEHSAACSY